MSDEVDDLEDGGGDDTETPALFALLPDEKPVVDEIIAGLRDRVAQQTTSPRELWHLSIALLALQRLPRPTPGVELDVTLVYRFNNEMSYVGFYIGGSSFRLQTGGSVYDPEVGGDNYSTTVLEVEPSGFRSSDGWFALSGWTENFRGNCRDKNWHLSFDWLGDEAQIEWDDEESDEVDYWDRLDSESEGEDE